MCEEPEKSDDVEWCGDVRVGKKDNKLLFTFFSKGREDRKVRGEVLRSLYGSKKGELYIWQQKKSEGYVSNCELLKFQELSCFICKTHFLTN